MFDDEEWRVVEDFPRYEVSDHGRVYDAEHNRILPQHLSNGYYHVSLGGAGSIAVHRLVAIAFLPNRSATRRVVDHLDTDKSYSAADNLEWVTPAENTYRAKELGLVPEPVRGPSRYYPRKKKGPNFLNHGSL